MHMARAEGKAVTAVRAVAETTAVAVTTVGAAEQATEEPHVHEKNLATSAAATSIFDLSAQNCCANGARRRDTASSIVGERRTQ